MNSEEFDVALSHESVLALGSGVVIICGIYPGILWVVGQTLFPFQANGSIVRDDDGKVIGSLLVAQPFTKDEYFQPRPSAASFDATASTSSGYGAVNYALRDRVARAIGPIVDLRRRRQERQARRARRRGVVPGRQGRRQPAYRRPMGRRPQQPRAGLGDRRSDPSAPMSTRGRRPTTPTVKDWIKANPGTPQPKASDLAVVFFKSFSNEHPGHVPVVGHQERQRTASR